MMTLPANCPTCKRPIRKARTVTSSTGPIKVCEACGAALDAKIKAQWEAEWRRLGRKVFDDDEPLFPLPPGQKTLT